VLPRSFSATSLDTAEKCLARYKAEVIDRGANLQGNAANVGIVCHGTLEDFLRTVFIRKDREWDEEFYWECFHKHSDAVLGPSRASDLYEDAHQIAHKWFHTKGRREDLESVQILSLESKNNFPLKTSAGEIPVNYIMDRLDRIEEGVYRVVDYKSNRVALTPNQLRKKLQARLYALMVQIKYKDAKEIWVQFDFLRHGPVEVKFTRDDNVVMFRELQRRAEDIIETPDDRAPETLNMDCGWCVRKASCKKLLSHQTVGGILGKTPEELAEMHYNLQSAEKARQILLDEVESALLQYCVNNDLLEFDTPAGEVRVELKSRRKLDSRAAGLVLEAAGVAKDYMSFTMASIDKLLKGSQLSDGQKMLLRMAISKEMSDPSIKVDHAGY
jgi:hypothetical protein